tara:strand:- start:2100 stop:2267 length:168 start_codon:yes stop_codon:yes gene_type:complete
MLDTTNYDFSILYIAKLIANAKFGSTKNYHQQVAVTLSLEERALVEMYLLCYFTL